MFSKYHYLDSNLHPACAQFVGYIGDKIVCHAGFIQAPLKKGTKRVHRLVVLPEYQGIGIGTAFITKCAEIVEDTMKMKVLLTTTTPSLTYALRKKPCWKLISYGRKGHPYPNNSTLGHLNKKLAKNRFIYTFLHQRGQ